MKRILPLLLLLALLPVGCTGPTASESPTPTVPASPVSSVSPTPTPDPTPTPTPTPRPLDADWAVSLGATLSTIDPSYVSESAECSVALHLFEGLMKRENSGKEVDPGIFSTHIAPGQAQRFEKTQGPDNTVVYTFYLREDALWSDGKPVTAQDFVYAWQRLANPSTSADLSDFLDCVKNGVQVRTRYAEVTDLGVKALDDRTFEVTLVEDVPWFLELCAHPATAPLRQDIIVAGGNSWTYDPSTCVGNGPYVLTAWDSSGLSLAPSDTYYAPREDTRDIVFYFADPDLALTAVEEHTLDFAAPVEAEAPADRIDSGDIGRLDYAGVYYLAFQTQKAPFDQAQVRAAFSLAIDRDALVREVTAGGELPAGGMVPPGVYDAAGASGDDFRTVGGSYFDTTGDGYAAACEEARRLLAAAGYPGGEGFPQVEYLYNQGAAHQAVAEALAEMWQRELGVTVTLKAVDWGTLLQLWRDGDYQITRSMWAADFSDPLTFLDPWVSDGIDNMAKYKSKDYDALIEAAQADVKQRLRALHQAEELLVEQDHVLCPLYFYTRLYKMDASVHGLLYDPTTGWFLFTEAGRG